MRSRCDVLLLCLCLLAASIPSFAQQSAAVPQRDPSALAVLQTALSAMGVQLSPPPSSVQVTGSTNPVGSSGFAVGTFTCTVSITSSGYEFCNHFQSGNGIQIFVSGHGAPAISVNGTVKPFLGHMTMASSQGDVPIPVLLEAYLNPAYTVTESATARIGNTAATHVHISNDADQVTRAVTPQEWYFDPTSGLPLHEDYRAPDPLDAMTWTAGARDFGNYQSVGGLVVPSQVTNSVGGTAMSITTISSVQLNVPVAQSQFDLP